MVSRPGRLILLLVLVCAASGRQAGCDEYGFVLSWGSEGSDDGQFRGPQGVATDAPGNVYVADWGNCRIGKFTSAGVFLKKWGSEGTGDGQFSSPCGVATDAAGHVYVTDYGNHRVQKFTSNGAFLAKWGSEGSGDGQLHGPYDIATDAAGNVYVADTDNCRIQKFTSAGGFLTKWGSQGTGDGQFSYPCGVATDAAGHVYVADYSGQRVQKFTSNGAFLTKWGSQGAGDGQFHGPYGIATDSAGNVYVGDTGNARIEKFTSAGAFLTKWGSYGTGGGGLSYPCGLDTDAAGYVYVADWGTDGVQKFGLVAANGPPTVPVACQITPAHPETTDDLTASASGSTDPDDDPIVYEYQWSRSTDEGTAWSAWGYDGATLAHELTATGEWWKARARASDATHHSDWRQSSVVVIGGLLSLRGHVFYARQQDLAGTAIELRDEWGDLLTTVAPGADGTWIMSGVPFSAYEVTPVKSGWSFAPEQQTVEATTDVTHMDFAAVPPPTPHESTTYWDVGMGLSAGASIGLGAELGPFSASAAKVSGSIGGDWNFQMAIENDPTAGSVLLINPSSAANGGVGFDTGEVDLGVASAHVGLSASASLGVTSGREYRFAWPLATNGDKMKAGFLVLNDVMLGPLKATPGIGLLANALNSALGSAIGHDELHKVTARVEASGGAALGASLSVGPGKSPVKATLKVAEVSAESSLATYADTYVHRQPDDPQMVLGVEAANQVDLSFLELKLAQRSGDAEITLNAPALLPHAGSTGVSSREIALDQGGSLQWVKASFGSDTQVPYALFGSTSDEETMELRVNGAVARDLATNYPEDLVADILMSAVESLPVAVGPTQSTDEFALLAASLCRYSVDHPGVTAATFAKKRDISQGTEFGCKLGIGIGVGIEVGFKGSTAKGWTYTEREGILRDGAARIAASHDASTVPPEDSRTFGDMCGELLVPLPGLVWDALLGLVTQFFDSVVDGLVDLIVGGDRQGNHSYVVAKAGNWGVGTTIRLARYEGGLMAAAEMPQKVRPYRGSVRRLTRGGLAFTPMIAVSEVQVIGAEDPGGTPIESWPEGAMVLRIPVSAQDLIDRSVDPALLDSVRIYHLDADEVEWLELATTQVEPGVFEALPTMPGEYVAGIASAAVDDTAPAVGVRPGDGGACTPLATLSAEVSDQPAAGLNAGIETGSIQMNVDGEGVAATVTPTDASHATITWTPDTPLVDGLHTVEVTATDRMEHTGTSGALGFNVVSTAFPELPGAKLSMFGLATSAFGQAPSNTLLRFWPRVWQWHNDPTDAPARYVMCPAALPAGQGVWVVPLETTTAEIHGVLATEPVVTCLQPGWNLVACGFDRPVAFADCQIENGGDVHALVGAPEVSPVIYGWDADGYAYVPMPSDGGGAFEAWQAYWVYATDACMLIQPVPSRGAMAPRTRVAGSGAQVGWWASLTASVGDSRDTLALIGAPDGIRKLPLPKPPSAPGSRVQIVPVGTGGTDLVWEFDVETDVAHEEVRLAWPDLSRLPRNWRGTLEDLATGARQSLRTVAGYCYDAGEGGGRRFRLTIEPNNAGTVLLSGLQAVPTRGGSTEIIFNLSTDAAVRGGVYNVAGVRVGDVATAGVLTRGLQTLTYDNRSTHGTILPAGTYLVRLTARAEDGDQCSATTMLRIPR